MKRSKGLILFYCILFLGLLMTNPPVLGWVNAYSQANPLTFSYPTLWVWLEFGYGIMILAFLIAAATLKEWDCHQDNIPIVPVQRNDDAKGVL